MAAWGAEVAELTLLDQPDPVALWREEGARQQRLIQWLAGKDRVVLKGANIDLTLSIQGRRFIEADGKYNFPDGEIFSAPHEDSVNGWVRFRYPAVYQGREVIGAQIWFENGRVTRACAEKNEAFLLSVLDTDPGARTLGEVAIGTNYGIDRFSRNILFDEKIGGTFHLAVGAGYPDTGATNQSAVHWDLIADARDAEISAGQRLPVSFPADGGFL